MVLAGSPQSTLNILREVYRTTGNTLKLWHYVRRDGGGSLHSRPKHPFGIARRVNVSKSSVRKPLDEPGFAAWVIVATTVPLFFR